MSVAANARFSARIPVLAVDPDLAAGLSGVELERAIRFAVAPVLELESGPWDPRRLSVTPTDGWLGLLVVDGLITRRVSIGRRSACELFGPGDLIRPWDGDGDYAPLPVDVRWRVLEPARFAVLTSKFAERVSRWPQLNATLMARAAQRARYLALTQAVTHIPRIHIRLLIVFWLLAERWGRVEPDGVCITLPLTHEVLAMLVGAQRPTVTNALKRLTAEGLLVRRAAYDWLVTRQAIERLPTEDLRVAAEAAVSD
jgi:hypothetical protein